MKKIIDKITIWWWLNESFISKFVTAIAALELILIILLAMQVVSNVKLLYDIESLLVAHGVDWALYTPAP